ncbi:MAG: cadmium-translocating P-type ATPase [Bacteroidota bacterium]|nr:cadmium-translocating P-type ATPase [Bacteroidota bacterium]
METVNWKVEGMSCSACAQTINGFLEKKGMKDVRVSLTAGEAQFRNEPGLPEQDLKKGIEGLGYHIAEPAAHKRYPNKFIRYLFICVPFTLILQLHMLGRGPLFYWLHNSWIQLILCLPVYVTGMYYFGKSSILSIKQHELNMNVLIALGATAAFIYSLTGTILNLGDSFQFYETAAAIITLVFFGNYLEERSLQSTQRALTRLVKSQKVTANMIAFDDQHQEIIFPVDSLQLRSGDLVMIRSGEQIPADAKILWGEGQVDESIITGESLPVNKEIRDMIVGGSILIDGNMKAQVTASAKDSVLSKMVDLVKRAQSDKPKIQLLADRISHVFVPTVIGISLLTFLLNYFILYNLSSSVMRSIAVLVIACPCAMGLATPAAIAVGLGRGARNGILFRKADSLELFKKINQIVFDKTGTLTTGSFIISKFLILDPDMEEEEFKKILFSMEKYSNHPIARSLIRIWKSRHEIRWKKIEEIKGHGLRSTSIQGDEYMAGSALFTGNHSSDSGHTIYLLKNKRLAGWVDMQDELRPEAIGVISYFKKQNIKTILLTGDRKQKSEEIALALDIDELFAEQTPQQKLEQIERLSALSPTAMVGDGINDAPALARASIGVSMSDASQIAMQTADVVLMNSGLKKLPLAMQLGAHTFLTIRQNLFWAFFYNLLAIPVAAFGLLTPGVAAAAMAFSDIVLIFNSSRLFVKKLQ